MSSKAGFWTVLAIVMSSQIGSGVLMQPAVFANYGLWSIVGLSIAAIGAIAFALVFAKLCEWLPKTGGPHAYVQGAFGKSAAFFTGWTYWVVAWVSNVAVVTATVGYLLPLTGLHPTVTVKIVLGLAFILCVVLVNLRGVSFAGHADVFLWVLKAVPLLVVPLAGLFLFNPSNFTVDPAKAAIGTQAMLGGVALLALWGFIGLETATASAGSIENPSRTIPRAVVFGTALVAIIYLLNALGVMGVIPGSQLAHSSAPYTDAAHTIFGGNWYLAISLISLIILFGTLTAWVLTSGQIVLGLAQDKFLPAIFGRKNKYGAPYFGLMCSTIGIVAVFILTTSDSIAKQVTTIIDISVTAFLFVYAVCCFAFFKLLFQKRERLSKIMYPIFYGCIALVFCAWMIYEKPVSEIFIAALFTLSGIPLYIKFLSKKNV